ncbi:hypothetical protein BJ322DRAFT_794731 [Thelephora terrestris]|uniref:Uncharacterized protein n=1 Tax=Thelephora terrestris TaxID=56493 RepID=A0A9P6HFK1_9AGAM|nr:hypothetical protein BJ322DRAFT_794731 [Thelephora terrestris]
MVKPRAPASDDLEGGNVSVKCPAKAGEGGLRQYVQRKQLYLRLRTRPTPVTDPAQRIPTKRKGSGNFPRVTGNAKESVYVSGLPSFLSCVRQRGPWYSATGLAREPTPFPRTPFPPPLCQCHSSLALPLTLPQNRLSKAQADVSHHPASEFVIHPALHYLPGLPNTGNGVGAHGTTLCAFWQRGEPQGPIKRVRAWDSSFGETMRKRNNHRWEP